MRIVQDTRPRYKVQGIRSLKGTTFYTEAEALRQAKIAMIMEILWRATDRIDYKVPNPAYAIASVLVDELDKEGAKSLQKLLLE